MLTPVVSKKQKSKTVNQRDVAKNLILRRAVGAGGEEAVKPITEQIPPKADTGATPPYTEEELVQLDLLFDMVSWLIYLYAGNFDMMNQLGPTIGLPVIDSKQAGAVKDKLRGKMDELVKRMETMVEKPEPIETSAVSDIQNEIKAVV